MPEDAVNLDLTAVLTPASDFEQSARGADKYADAIEKASRALSNSIGPRERLIGAQKQLDAELDAGGLSFSRYRDLQNAVQNAGKSVQRADAKLNPQTESFSDGLASSLYSSRVGNGSGLMPLLGKGLDAATGGQGMAILSNPYVQAAAAAVEFGKQVYAVAERAAVAAREFSDIRFAGGGTNGETAQIQALGKAIGINLAATAERLNERITSDPMARGIASQYGVSNVAGYAGDQDYTKNLIKIVESLRKITDQNERLRVARTLGVQDVLPLTNLSDASFNGLKRDAEIRSRIMDTDFQRQSQDFQTEAGRAANAIEDLSTALGKKFLPIINPITRTAANIGEGAANALNNKSIPEVAFDVSQLLINPAQTIMRLVGEGVRNFGKTDGAVAVGDASSPTNELAKAMNELTKAIRSQRGKDAMPGSIGGTQIARLAEVGALQFPAI